MRVVGSTHLHVLKAKERDTGGRRLFALADVKLLELHNVAEGGNLEVEHKGGVERRADDHGDAELVEPGVGTLDEADGGDGLFVGVDLGGDGAGAVVERGVNEPVADR